jgi:hypothetical protein
MRPEFQLLVACARTGANGEASEAIRALARQGLDWHSVSSRALQHGLLPLLYRRLDALCPEAVPDETMAQLRSRYREMARTTLFLEAEMVRILETLASEGIRALPFKGPALAVFVYGDASLRQPGDLDILVRAQDAPKAGEVLRTLGFVLEFEPPASRERAVLDHDYMSPFSREGRVHVEMHWEIAERRFAPPFDHAGAWARRREVRLGGVVVPSLSPEDLLLVLCIHGTKHLWERLVWIADVAELVRSHSELDWDWTLQQARRNGVERTLLLGLRLASELVAAPLPERAGDPARRDPRVGRLAGQTLERIFAGNAGPPGLVEGSLFHLRALDRFRDRVRYCAHLALTPTPRDWAAIRLPAALAPLYYLVRPLRLAGKYALRLEVPGRAVSTSEPDRKGEQD